MAEHPAAKSTAPLPRLPESLPASDTTAEVPVQSALWATSTNGRNAESANETQQLLPKKLSKKVEYSARKPIGRSNIDAYMCVYKFHVSRSVRG